MNMIKYMVVWVLFLTGLVGCEQRKNATPPKNEELVVEPTNPLHDKKLMYALIDSSLTTGDERVYSKVATYYLIGGQEQEFFYCAVRMANKYNNAMAYFHVYLIISISGLGPSDTTFKNIDNKSRDFALYNLLKSYELDPQYAKYYVERIFGKKKPIPKSATYLKKFCAD